MVPHDSGLSRQISLYFVRRQLSWLFQKAVTKKVFLSQGTVKPVLKDHPICYNHLVSQNRCSLVTGSMTLKCRTFCLEYVVLQNRWSTMAVVSQDMVYCSYHTYHKVRRQLSWLFVSEGSYHGYQWLQLTRRYFSQEVLVLIVTMEIFLSEDTLPWLILNCIHNYSNYINDLYLRCITALLHILCCLFLGGHVLVITFPGRLSWTVALGCRQDLRLRDEELDQPYSHSV